MPPRYPATTHRDVVARSVGDEREGSQLTYMKCCCNLDNCVSKVRFARSKPLCNGTTGDERQRLDDTDHHNPCNCVPK